MRSSDPDDTNLEAAHKHSIHHREEVLGSELCGCFYCGQTFQPAEIEDWCDEHQDTAICPRCHIDSVIGSRPGFPLTPEFLQRMRERWFHKS